MFFLSQKTIKTLGFFTNNSIKNNISFNELVDNTNLLQENYAIILQDSKNYSVFQLLNRISQNNIVVFLDAKYSQFIKSNFIKPTWIFCFSNNLSKNSKFLIKQIYPIEKILKNIYSIAITGTNGKTSITQFTYNSIKKQQLQCTSVGTLGILCNNQYYHTKLTTPSILTNKQIWYKSYKEKTKYIIMEVSSHAIQQKRLESLEWDIAVFTNLTQEHLDYHKTIKQYYITKRKLFLHMFLQKIKVKPNIIINIDDNYGKQLYNDIKKFQDRYKNKFLDIKPTLITLGKNGDLQIKDIYPALTGYLVEFAFRNKSYTISSKLLGKFNIYNLLSTLLILNTLQPYTSIQKICSILETIVPPTGRMFFIQQKKKIVIIDYAHTPNALINLFQTVLELCTQKICIVFGCGGERDQEKRQVMGEIADKYASNIILTNDNPRNENPDTIINHIKKGISNNNKVIIEPNRKDAIQKGIQIIKTGDILLVVGKGHEEIQIIGENEYAFSDIKIVKAFLQ